MNRLVTITGHNMSICDILDQIGSFLDIDFFLAEDRDIIVKEIYMYNQPLLKILNYLCNKFSLAYRINGNSVEIVSNNPITRQVYRISFFHTNDANGPRKFSKNDEFWNSVEEFLKKISSDFVIDKYSGSICITCDTKGHNLVKQYIQDLEKFIYTPVAISCTFIEYIDSDDNKEGLSNILSNALDIRRLSTENVVKNIMQIIKNVTNNRLNKNNCKIIAQKTLILLSQQVAHINVRDTHIKERKETIISKRIEKIQSKTDEHESDGILFTVTPLIVKDKIICKVMFEVNRTGPDKDNIKKSGISTTIALHKNKPIILGDLSSTTKIQQIGKWFFGLLSYKYNEYKKTNIILLIHGSLV